MAEDKISDYIDLAAVGQQTDQFIALLDKVEKKFNTLNGIKLSLDGLTKAKDIAAGANAATTAITEMGEAVKEVKEVNEEYVKASKDFIATSTQQAKTNQIAAKSFDDLIKQQVENQRAGKELQKQRKELDKAYQDGIITNEHYQESLEAIAKEELALKTSNNDLARALRNMEKEAQAAEGSLNEMRAKLNLALQAYDRLSKAEKQSDVGKGIKANIDALTEAISEEEQATGRFQRNVGNYSGALKTLSGALLDVKKKIDDYSASGQNNLEVLEALKKEEQLLEQLVNSQVAGFATATAEIKENTKALQQMAAAGLEGTEAYNKLFAETAALKDETADLKAALNNAAPDDALFNAATDAAKGLIGVYGLAQSAAALFGDENKALQETMVKLQAVETALQSIEAIRNVFKKENAVMQARTILLQKIEIAQTQLATAAESKNIIVKYGAIAAQRALNFVTSAAGGGLLILISLLAAAATSMAAYGSEAEDTAATNERLAKSLENTNNAISKGSESIKQRGDKALAQLESDFAAEEDLRKQREQSLADDVENIKRLNELDIKNREKAQKQVQKLLQQKFKQGGFDDEEQAELDKAIQTRDGYVENLAKQTAKENELEVLRLNNKKATIEQEAKERQEGIELGKIELSNRARVQADILANDENSYDKRLAALKEFTRLQVAIQRAEQKKQLDDPNLKNDPKKRALIEATAQAAITQAQTDGEKQRQALIKERANREKVAQFELAKLYIQSVIDSNAKVADNENKSLVDRLDALTKFQDYQKRMITAQRDFDLSNTKLLESERKAIIEKSRQEELKVQVDFLEKSYQIQLQNLQKTGENSQAKSNTRRDNYLTQLNEQFQAGEITEETYRKRKVEAAERYAKDELNILIDFLGEEIRKRRDKGEDVTKLEAAYAKARSDRAQQETDEQLRREEEVFRKRVEKLQRYQEIANNVFSAITEIVSIGTDAELAQIDEQIHALDEKKEKDIEVATSTIVNEKERAAAIQAIEISAAGEKEALEKKRRQAELEQARFEKAANIARIISDTAVAVVTTLGDKTIQPGFLRIPLAASIGILGAAQLARVIATPLPKYADGTEDHPGGKAILGDGGRRELVVTPDGRLMMSDKVPQVFDIPAHSVVLPDADAVINSARNTGYVKVPSGNPHTEEALNKALINEYKRGTSLIVQSIKGKKEVHIEGSHAGVMMLHKHSADYWMYINENVNF
jgi:hypothetical protein